MLSTKNFYEFKDYQEIIPVVHDLESQELALGTGSVIEKMVFLCFYTAHNGRLLPKEMFMLSISNDNMISGKNKILLLILELTDLISMILEIRMLFIFGKKSLLHVIYNQICRQRGNWIFN